MEAAVALTLGIAVCAVGLAEKMQHGSEVQLDPVSAGCEGVCQDAPMSIVGSLAMFRIDPSLEGGQQSAEW